MVRTEVHAVLVAWLVLGVVLLAVELHHLGFFALFGAVGAFGGAAVAAVAPDAVPLQAAVAVSLTVAGLVAVRPYVSRAVEHGRRPHQIRGTTDALVGSEATTLDEVGDTHGTGHVRLYGERWLAVSGADRPIPAGVEVVVTAVRGTTLVVWPTDVLSLDEGRAEPATEPDGSAGRPADGPAGEDDAPDGAEGRNP